MQFVEFPAGCHHGTREIAAHEILVTFDLECVVAIVTLFKRYVAHSRNLGQSLAHIFGLETAFAVLYTELVESGVLPLELLLERMSAGPARAYGLPVPRIAVGEPANLVLLDPQASWKVSADGFRSRSVNSWLLGRTLKGKVRATIAAGRLVYES